MTIEKKLEINKHYAKRIGFVNKRPDLTLEQFVAHWTGVHAVLCQRIPRLRRYAINVIDRAANPHMPFDGFSELWFDSVEDHDAAFASPQGVELLADAKNFTEKLTGVLVREERFIWPDHHEFEG
ncbi:MAG: EthD family reductase [Burkholderiaceae bacterium]